MSSLGQYSTDRTEDDLERVRMALAEGGFPNAVLVLAPSSFQPGLISIRADPMFVTAEAFWQALQVARLESSCWRCWCDKKAECQAIGQFFVQDCGRADR